MSTGPAVSANADAKRDAKRDAILSSALVVFTRNGYVGTSTDQLAAAASISKQTLYKTFGDKEGLFSSLIHFECERILNPFSSLLDQMRSVATAGEALSLLADQFAMSIMNSHVQQLRRLVIAEAARFPHLGLDFWERGFLPTLEALGRCLEVLNARGLLTVPDPLLAANHFAGMLLWIPSNQTMFASAAKPITAEELRPTIDAGTAAFLRAYAGLKT